jgi:hypothetical protein
MRQVSLGGVAYDRSIVNDEFAALQGLRFISQRAEKSYAMFAIFILRKDGTLLSGLSVRFDAASYP